MSKKLLLRTLSIVFLLSVLTPMTALAIPGPQRMLVPGWFGFKEVKSNIFVPPSLSPEITEKVIRKITNAEKNVARYFNSPISRPIIVICPSTECNPVFGRKDASGIAYGKRVIRLNGNGVHEMIATHELVHTTVKKRVGEFRTYFGAIPAWFEEGLAVLVSRDKRYPKNIPDYILQALQQQPHWRQWGELIHKYGWRNTYGGAEQLVANLEKKIGKKGLLTIIDRVAAGEQFDNVIKSLPPLRPN